MSWNQVVVLGILINAATLALGWRMRSASPASIERRCRWVIRLTLGFAAVLLVSVLVPLARFAWLSTHDAPPEDQAYVLGAAIASGMNLVMGFLAFGTFPTGMAFRMARLAHPESHPESQAASHPDGR